METVHDTDAVFEAVGRERPARDDRQVHDGRRRARCRRGCRKQTRRVDRRERRDLRKRWHGARRRPAARGVRAALRGVVLARAARSGRRACRPSSDALVHTHASESRDEIAIVRQLSGGLTNLEYLAQPCASRRRTCAPRTASGSTSASRRCSPSTTSRCCTAPGSNLKLGSGIAPVAEMRARGITVSLGADGAACNNRLDMFEEMRLAAMLQAMRTAAGRAAGARRAVDGDARRRAHARARATRSDRSRSASAPTSSSSIATGRTWRPGPIRTRRWSTPPAAPTSGRRSSTASSSSTTVAPVRVDRARSRGRGARGGARARVARRGVYNVRQSG